MPSRLSDPLEATHDRRSAAHRRSRGAPSVSAAARSAGESDLQGHQHHRPQDDRRHVHGRELYLLLHRRSDGVVDARRAGETRPAILVQRAIQPTVHHARHRHVAVLRDPCRLRICEPGAAAADRRARRGLPPPERTVVLAVRLRSAHRVEWLHRPWRGGRFRVDRLHASFRRDPQSRCGSRPLGIKIITIVAYKAKTCNQFCWVRSALR